MGFLDRFLDNNSSGGATFWESVDNESQVDEIILASNQRPQVVFKHSNYCGTSFMAKQNMELIKKSDLDDIDLYMIDVVRERPISRYFADKVQIRHESPQLFVMKNGEVIWHGSHYMVNGDNLIAALNQARG